jgi:glycosyltransferase involved in cell wall biosynthesis
MSAEAGRLRVGLDVTPAIIARSGLRTYGETVWRHLASRDDVDVKAFAVGRGADPELPVARARLPLGAVHLLWRVAPWPSVTSLVGDVDVVHSMDLVAPPTKMPLVVTVFDVIALTMPELCSPRTRRQQRQHLKSAQRADVVIAPCQTTADEIATVGNIPRERIAVTLMGGRQPDPRPGAPPRPGPYILSVSTIEPRKGYEVLATAVGQVPDCPPVLVAGPDGYRAQEIRRAVRDLDRHGRIEFLGDVRDPGRMEALYRHATLVVQPSLAEGFGFPVVEAMGLGAPILATALPQTRELAADAVEMVAAGDAEALADGIRSLLGDDKRRDELRALASERGAEFTWERNVDGLVAAYRHAAGN